MAPGRRGGRKEVAALGVLALLAVLTAASTARGATTITVDCNKFESLDTAVNNAQNGDTLKIIGRCIVRGLIINSDISLQGISDDAEISASAGSTTTTITVAPGRNVSISGLTISDGRRGGINNYGTLLLSDSVLKKNVAGGGLDNQRRAWVIDSTIKNNTSSFRGGGGGIYDEGNSLTLQRTTVSGNTSYTNGGGIYTESGTVRLENSTIANNVTDGTEGKGRGGGIYNVHANVTVDNSTISGNRAGAARTADGRVGGVYALQSDAPIRTQNTIIANNFDLHGNLDCGGALKSQGRTLLSTTEGCTYNPGPGDIVANPKLGPLGDNGGPTSTMTLANTSAAIDQVPAAGAGCPATDQRGIARPQGPACDIGAVEVHRQPPGTPPNTKISRAKINQNKGTATLRFRAIGGAATGFQCALRERAKHRKSSKLRFRGCHSPKTYDRLRKGRYTFEVRALSAVGKDPTPAKKKFEIS